MRITQLKKGGYCIEFDMEEDGTFFDYVRPKTFAYLSEEAAEQLSRELDNFLIREAIGRLEKCS